jgi:hypothetical protein
MKIFVYGLVTGLLFGFLLQKGRVLRYDKQVGALRLQDMTIVKFMLSSVIVGMVGIYLLSDLGLAKLSIKAAILDPPSSAPLFSVWVGVFSGIARALPPGLYRSARRPSR